MDKDERLANAAIKREAKKLLMKKYNLSEDKAFHFLQKAAMDNRVTIIEISSRVIQQIQRG